MKDETVAAIERVEKFIRELTLSRGLDREEIRGLHVGTEREAVLTVTDLRTLIASVREAKP